ncbi:MAG TPA: cytochrome c-type biogenesis protein CcmH [Candidatus Polarisedimenticolia bacterium]|nr:cytochrome c-type biogenesis protein CcmH [Candidatus Polarisedimenticolia bacterium]
MSDATPPQEPAGAAPQRTVPVAALAGAVVLIGLVGFALYRRGTTSTPATAETSAAGASDTAAPADEKGTPIIAKAPFRLSPEAAILAERYRCICGCNDNLSVCTCKNPNGSEDMKRHVQGLADQGKSPEEADAAMEEKFGAASLLKNPAPPQTLPSHAGNPPAAQH